MLCNTYLANYGSIASNIQIICKSVSLEVYMLNEISLVEQKYNSFAIGMYLTIRFSTNYVWQLTKYLVFNNVFKTYDLLSAIS